MERKEWCDEEKKKRVIEGRWTRGLSSYNTPRPITAAEKKGKKKKENEKKWKIKNMKKSETEKKDKKKTTESWLK